MSRTLLQIVLPLLLPSLLYLAWAFVFRRQNALGNGETPHWVREGPWFWLIIAGVVLMAIGLGVTAWQHGGPPSGTYVPARVEDGRVVPGRIE